MTENQGGFISGCTLVAVDNLVVLLYCPPVSTNMYLICKRNKKTVQES